MIVIIEGPDKSGKSHLIREVLKGFDEDKSHEKIFSNRDEQDGFGYMDEFTSHLDSNHVSVWHRSWVSEVVYGKALGQPRQLAEDEFLGEWFYSRLLNGRGGNFILLPEDLNELGKRRNESDFDIATFDPIAEYNAYKLYAERWGYEIMLNDYSEADLIANTVQARRSAYGFPMIQIPSTEYIGPPNPTFTFVGQVLDDFAFTPKPFNSRFVAEYFRPFGIHATRLFGYATIESFKKNHRRYPNLFKRAIGVGGSANLQLPELPNIYMQRGFSVSEEVERFVGDFGRMVDIHYSGVRYGL